MFSHAAMACWGLLVSLRAASCTLCVELTGYFSSKTSANSDPCFVRVANPLAGRPGRPRRRPEYTYATGFIYNPAATGAHGKRGHASTLGGVGALEGIIGGYGYGDVAEENEGCCNGK